MAETRIGRLGWPLALLCLAAGVLFFASLDRLWPLANLDLNVDRDVVIEQARDHLRSRGFEVADLRAIGRINVNGPALDYVERTFGREQAQEWIRAGHPLFEYQVLLKRHGSPTRFRVLWHPEIGVSGWTRSMEEDEPGASLSIDEARALAESALGDMLETEASLFSAQSSSSHDRPDRRDHYFGFERDLQADPELRERVGVVVAGDRVVAFRRSLIVPAAAARDARSRRAPREALQLVGFVLLGMAAIVACWVFLTRLGAGEIDLRRVWFWPTATFVFLMGAFALERPSVFASWDPLWPKWISDFQYLVGRAGATIWLIPILLALVAAGEAIDRQTGAGRATSLLALGRGRLTDPAVARASGRGFLIGLLCGGAMTAAVLLLQLVTDAPTGLQPRGFFFYTLNTTAPALTSILFFMGVALSEELGYRFFLGSWLMQWRGSRALAIGLPALIYGLTHTSLTFLPTAEPFWARALILTVVGAVWGWAFLRYDALTVVLSHFTADLFIFNWPRLASGDAWIVGTTLATFVVPLAPLLLSLVRIGPRHFGARESR